MSNQTEPTVEELEKEESIVEMPKFDIIQPDLFKDYIRRDEDFSIVFSEETPFEIWEPYTRGILEAGRRSMRDAGECLIFGERKYGEKYAQVIDAMRYSPKTLQNATWVVSHVKTWFEKLSFAHHEVVAALPHKAQNDLLTIAEDEGLTVSKLKKVKNEKYPDKKRPSKPSKTAPAIDLTDENSVLQAGHMLIAYIEKAEADLPFRKWPKERVAKWKGIVETIAKVHRRGFISTHGKK